MRDIDLLIRAEVLSLLSNEGGQDVVEYGVLIATIALVVLVGTLTFGNQIQPWLIHLAGAITTTGT